MGGTIGVGAALRRAREIRGITLDEAARDTKLRPEQLEALESESFEDLGDAVYAREMLRIVLELAGHEVHEAVDGPSGLARALDLRPDIALVDIGLPGFDGLEMARRVRDAVGASIHLVALTGYGQPDDRRQALGAGFDAHLVKPVHPPALLAALRAEFSAAREA